MRKELFLQTLLHTSQTTGTNLLTEEQQIRILGLIFFLRHLLGNELLVGQLEDGKERILLCALNFCDSTQCHILHILCGGKSERCKDTE